MDGKLSPLAGRLLKLLGHNARALDDDHGNDHPGISRNQGDEAVNESSQFIKRQGNDQPGA